MLKPASDISFDADKTISSYVRESIKIWTKELKSYLIFYFNKNILNRLRPNFPYFAFTELTDAAKNGCVRVQ